MAQGLCLSACIRAQYTKMPWSTCCLQEKGGSSPGAELLKLPQLPTNAVVFNTGSCSLQLLRAVGTLAGTKQEMHSEMLLRLH